jgi:hypothetical protein
LFLHTQQKISSLYRCYLGTYESKDHGKGPHRVYECAIDATQVLKLEIARMRNNLAVFP